MIRLFQSEDCCKVAQIHRDFYADEFELPDLCSPQWLGKYIVTDDFNNTVLFGGVRLLLESVAMTDKRYSARERRSALLKLLQASLFATQGYGFSQLHAFIQDSVWEKHLKKYGFRDTKGSALVINT